MDGAVEKITQLTQNTQIQDDNPEQQGHRWSNPIWIVVQQGISQHSSPLSNLQGIPHVLEIIWNHVEKYWSSHVILGKQEQIRMYHPHHGEFCVKLDKRMPMFYGQEITWEDEGTLTFPEPSGINVNMMPFIMAATFEESFLPDYLEPYFDNLIVDGILKTRAGIMRAQMGKVCYLSVQESWIEENTSQRRPGLHTESPGKLTFTEQVKEMVEEDTKPEEQPQKATVADSKDLEKQAKVPEYGEDWEKDKQKSTETQESQQLSTMGRGSTQQFNGIHRWGMSLGYLQGGIYMASTVKNSCKIWDCQILTDEEEQGDIIGALGDIEHLRGFLPSSQEMDKDTMYWITDRTPHESLPVQERTHRQWFRLVTSGVSLWFQDHSTANVKGIVPDQNVTKIVKGSKFDENNLVLIE